ncbi:MAG: hypothetical protein ACRDY1_16000 [Acidimicrobiales bacterium]
MGLSLASGVIAVVVLVILVAHKDGALVAGDCPAAATVDRTLATQVAAPSAVNQENLLACFYARGTDDQAVAVTFAVPSNFDNPCGGRPPIRLAGGVGCNATGTSGTGPGSLSLLVVHKGLQYQFTAAVRGLRLPRLEALAAATLAAPPPPVQRLGRS